MSLVLPSLVSSDNNLNSYCNFIEYSSFCNGDMRYDEFDIDESGLEQKDILKELNRRLQLYDKFRPYKIGKSQVISLLANKVENLHYFYCLYFAVKGGTSDHNHTNVFEKITDYSLKNYFGTTLSLITSIGQNSSNLINTIDNIKDVLSEKKGNYEEMSVQAKDGGIDIITYKPVDNRGNQIVCLTDATIGKNWKREKVVITKLRYWCHYIHFKVTPLTCLSVVHILDDSEFYSASNNNGLIFDRARIMRYYKKGNSSLDSVLKSWVSIL